MTGAIIELTPEQREIQAVCREFAQNEIRPISLAVDEADTEMPWEVWHKAADLGLTVVHASRGVRRRRHDRRASRSASSRRSCAWGCAGIGNLITSGGFFAKPVLELGTTSSSDAGSSRSAGTGRR